MAIFLDVELAPLVSLNALILVLREAAKALLDPRLAPSPSADYSELDSATCKKMAKAINKLAIQATYGASRHLSLQALFALQVQLCSSLVYEDVPITEVGNINCRMSRIITKLFTRVMKAEEVQPKPFSEDNLDLEALFCALEDMLMSCYSIHGNEHEAEKVDDRMRPCLIMGRTFLLQLLKSKQDVGDVNELDDILVSLNLNNVASHFGSLFKSCCEELGLHSNSTFGSSPPTRAVLAERDKFIANMAGNKFETDHTPTSQISRLLFSVGSADGEEETTAALNQLRAFVDTHKEVDFEPHLKNLSAPFRAYILSKPAPDNGISLVNKRSLSSLRQRLAAANEISRSTFGSGASATSSIISSSSTSGRNANNTTGVENPDSVSSAAALRARLESVKRKYV